ncbi:hypothetical protein LSAT2_023494, partial [Lamellibrachia satsuma]
TSVVRNTFTPTSCGTRPHQRHVEHLHTSVVWNTSTPASCPAKVHVGGPVCCRASVLSVDDIMEEALISLRETIESSILTDNLTVFDTAITVGHRFLEKERLHICHLAQVLGEQHS